MPFPAGLTLVTVHGRFDTLPSGGAAGRIRFDRPSTLVGQTDNSIVPALPPVTANLDANGEFTVQLPATNDPQWTPVDWAYTVTATIGPDTIRGTLQLDYQTTTVELADLLQVDGAAEVGVTYATLATVTAQVAALTGADLDLTIADVADLQTQLDGKLGIPVEPYLTAANIANLVSDESLTEGLNLKADKASPALTGTPTAPTASAGTSSTQLATTAFVQGKTPVETVFTTPGAAGYADPGATCKYLDVTIVAPGGGGGSGRRGAAASVRSGGAGGGGGGLSRALIPYAAVTFPVTVTVGTAGTGGAAVSANDTNGNAGNAATATSFGTLLRATGGGGGAGGSTGAATGGFSGGGTTFGQTGTSSSGTGGVPGNPSAFASGPTAGGAGGGITSGDSPSNGGTGGAGHNSTAGTAGVVGGAAAGAGPSQPASSGLPGNGGGGGAGSITTAAGAGAAAGLYGAGGGGGGASLNGNASGAGGDGGGGIVRVVAFF